MCVRVCALLLVCVCRVLVVFAVAACVRVAAYVFVGVACLLVLACLGRAVRLVCPGRVVCCAVGPVGARGLCVCV